MTLKDIQPVVEDIECKNKTEKDNPLLELVFESVLKLILIILVVGVLYLIASGKMVETIQTTLENIFRLGDEPLFKIPK